MSVPAKVTRSMRQAVQVVSVAQSLAQLARDRAESMFTRMNCVFLRSTQYSVRIVGLERDNSHWHTTYPGTRKGFPVRHLQVDQIAWLVEEKLSQGTESQLNTETYLTAHMGRGRANVFPFMRDQLMKY